MTTTPTGDLPILIECHREKLTIRQRHVAVARLVTNYAFNNTYQYIIAREDVHLTWLEAAIEELGGTPASVPEPALRPAGGKGNDAFLPLVGEDARLAEEFVKKWRGRIGELANACSALGVADHRFLGGTGRWRDSMATRHATAVSLASPGRMTTSCGMARNAASCSMG